MASPNDDHPISVERNQSRVRVLWRGRVVADTTHALNLIEASYPVVHYIPREDVAMAHLVRSPHQTRCPYKGAAGYYSLTADGRITENAVWTYEAPLPAVAAIAGYLAFYPTLVDRIEETQA